MLREPGKGRKEEEEGGLLRTIGVKLWQGEREVGGEHGGIGEVER